MPVVLIRDFVTTLQVNSLGTPLRVGRMAPNCCAILTSAALSFPSSLIFTVTFCLWRWWGGGGRLFYSFHLFSSLSAIPIPGVVKFRKSDKHMLYIKLHGKIIRKVLH